jgi:ferritin
MLSDKMEEQLNEQINAEIYSGYLYYAMEAYFEDEDLTGFASWMHIQAQEELLHAQKFFDFINERGGRVELDAIEKPKKDWNSPLEAFQDAYEHETKVTDRINKLYDLALKENDHATASFLNWFIDEQVEEEASADEIVNKLERIGDSGHGIFMLDNELGSRKLDTAEYAEESE